MFKFLLVVFVLSLAPLHAQDFNRDCVYDIADFNLFVEHFGKTSGADFDFNLFDLDGDGEIGIGDFLLLVDVFGNKRDDGPCADSDINVNNDDNVDDNVDGGGDGGGDDGQGSTSTNVETPTVTPVTPVPKFCYEEKNGLFIVYPEDEENYGWDGDTNTDPDRPRPDLKHLNWGLDGWYIESASWDEDGNKRRQHLSFSPLGRGFQITPDARNLVIKLYKGHRRATVYECN